MKLTLSEFKIRFTKEIKNASESFMRAELTKPYFKLRNIDEADFYFDLQWNFNYHACSDWYIDKI